MLNWAGIGIIVGIQVATFLYTLRRLDSLQNSVGEVKERTARLEGILIGRQDVGNGAMTQTGDD